MSRRPTARTYRLLAATIVLLAFILRTYRFAELPPGLFFDEAYNALDGLAVLHDGAHPVFFAGNNGREPFYIYFQSLFLLWGSIAPFVVRLPSVFLGTLTVALTYPLVRRLLAAEEERCRETIALLATFILATLQWHLNFSRTGFRAIAQPFFEALAFYFFYRGAQELALLATAKAPAARQTGVSGSREPSRSEQAAYSARTVAAGRFWWRWFLLAGAAFGVSLYTYLSSRLVPLAVGALVVVALIWGQRLTRRYAVGAALLALAAAAVASPLALYYLRHPDLFVGHSKDVSLLNFGGLATLVENAWRLAGMFNWAGDVNWRHNLPGRPVFDPLIGLFFLLGVAVVAVRLRKAWRHPTVAPDGYLLPVVVVPVMLLPSLLSEGAPHFLRAIGALPFLALFPAVGIDAAWRWLRLHGEALFGKPLLRPSYVALALVLAFAAAATFKGYFVDWGGRPDPYYHFDGPYLEFASYVKAQDPRYQVYLSPWLADHATARLFLRGFPYAVFDSERTLVLTGKDALYAFHEGGVDIDTAPAFAAKLPVPVAVEHLPDRYGRAAFGFYRLPASASPVGQDFLARSAPRLGPIERPAGVPPEATISFGDAVNLLGFTVGPPQERAAGDHTITAGITLPVTLVWRAPRPIPDNLTVSMRLVDGNGRTWAQSDGLAGGERYLTSQWRPEEIILDRPPLLPPADLPPGEYRLAMSVYSLVTKRTYELRIDGQPRGEVATLGTVRVAEPAPGALAAMRPPHALDAPFGPRITLLGYGLDRDAVKPGESLDLDLFWKVEQDVGTDLTVDLRLSDSLGQPIAERRGPPIGGSYPTSRWRAGDALRDNYRLVAAAKAAPGRSTIRLALVDPASGATVAEASLDGPEIAGREHSFAAPAPRFGRADRFGDKIQLLGFSPGESVAAEDAADLPRLAVPASAALPVTLFWRSLADMDTSYTVFVQLLDARGQLAAQDDGLPQEGAAPTSGWLPEEVVADTHAVSLRPDLPPGDYTLIAGLYNAMDGKRLPVGEGDFVRLAVVHVSSP